MMGSVLQPWLSEIPMMQQTVLLTAVRGPDGLPKYHSTKYLLRWFRRCILLSAMDQRVITDPLDTGGGSFTGPSLNACPTGSWQDAMDVILGDYLRGLDEVPHHFQLHLMHAAEIVGYKHPDPIIRGWWLRAYERLVHDMHLWPETAAELDTRLGDNREGWLARADKATVA